MAATRVYILAKELGVKSKAIVEKCQAEELDIKNHMSTISAGLAATIREWFSEGENVTTIEKSSKVDLKKVRVKRRAPKKTKKTEEQQPEQKVEEPQLLEPQVSEEKPQPKPVVEEPEKTEPEPEPEPIKPAGPMMKKPAPAKLNGPKVVRVEEAEPERVRRPRQTGQRFSHARPRRDAPVTEPLMPRAGAGTVSSTDDAKGKAKSKRKDRTHGRRHGEAETDAQKKGKFSHHRRQKDLEERRARLAAAGGEGLRLRPSRKISTRSHGESKSVQHPEKVTISEPIIVKDLSAALAIKVTAIITKLITQGVMATANQVISPEVAELVALEFGTELIVERKASIEDEIQKEFEQKEKNNLEKRSVIVTMLGHVDHGKTSLLDKIRSTHVASGEAGGITQHIGAYQVSVGDSKITFLDTPGHEAFTAMRARGANMTDVVVLVVAADDGIMPQTIEAIHHAKAAEVPVIIALNKCDLPGCDFNRIYAQFSEHDLVPIEWGGKTEVVKTSAITGEGIDELLEHLDYTTELLELKADNTVPASGWVVEAEMDPKRGPVATLLIKEGMLGKGDVVLAGSAYGRIKAMKNSYGRSLKGATSSMPVEVTGLNAVPQAGDKFYRLEDINRAKNAAEESTFRLREDALAERTQVTLENLFSQIEAGNVKELNIIIRADVQGSVDVLMKYLSELSTEEVKIKILHASTGGITEGDVVLAEASNAIIIGFNVIADDYVAKQAESHGVDVRLYTIIYQITEELRKSMEGLLEPEEQEKSVGRAVIRNTFKVSRLGTIAGCYVNDGVVRKNAKVRLIRDSVIIRDNLTIETLKHFKDDVREVKTGLECGIKVAKFDDVKIDDIFDLYEIVEIARTLS
ncbi:MAG: translation initiation factor IF-2 [Planctomycetes bacterium]|nr:translation initiation factor IF-2 [Planctomycetota bacterium]